MRGFGFHVGLYFHQTKCKPSVRDLQSFATINHQIDSIQERRSWSQEVQHRGGNIFRSQQPLAKMFFLDLCHVLVHHRLVHLEALYYGRIGGGRLNVAKWKMVRFAICFQKPGPGLLDGIYSDLLGTKLKRNTLDEHIDGATWHGRGQQWRVLSNENIICSVMISRTPKQTYWLQCNRRGQVHNSSLSCFQMWNNSLYNSGKKHQSRV